MNDTPNPLPLKTLARRAAVVVVVGTLLTVLVLGAGYAFGVLMMAFAGILFAVFLRTISDNLNRVTHLGETVCLGLTVLLLLGIVVGFGWYVGPQVAEQAQEMRKTLPASVEQLKGEMARTETGRWLLSELPTAKELNPDGQAVMARISGVFSTALSAVVGVVVVFFVGLYLAAQPRMYLNGTLRLVPPNRRERGREVLEKVGTALRRWLMGQVLAMLFVGVLVWLAMLSLGLPFALSLGVIAAVLTFIPNFGPLLALVPAVLLGLMDGPATALWVVGLYTGIQVVESYVLTPFIQQSAVSLPAALTITAQVVLGVFLGGVGLAVATPLLVVVLVLTRELYVRDFLGDDGARGFQLD